MMGREVARAHGWVREYIFGWGGLEGGVVHTPPDHPLQPPPPTSVEELKSIAIVLNFSY